MRSPHASQDYRIGGDDEANPAFLYGCLDVLTLDRGEVVTAKEDALARRQACLATERDHVQRTGAGFLDVASEEYQGAFHERIDRAAFLRQVL